MDKDLFVNELAKLRSSSTFLHIKSYMNSYGELANYSIVFHMSYQNALERSIDIVSSFEPKNELQIEAKAKVMTSYMKSLLTVKTTPIEDLEDAYTRFTNEDGSYIKGVKLHTESNTLHIYGLQVHKKIIIPGDYPKVNKKPLTIEQDLIKKLTPLSKFRQFKLASDNFESISVEGIKLLPPDSDLIL